MQLSKKLLLTTVTGLAFVSTDAFCVSLHDILSKLSDRIYCISEATGGSDEEYEAEIKNASQPFTLVFSETYDTLWQAKIEGEIIPSKIIYGAFNSFQLDKKGNFDLTVEFTAQKYVWWGGIISLLTLTTSIFLLFRKKHQPS